MMIIEFAFAFAFVSLIIMCCAFRERASEPGADDTILTSEQHFHAFVELINTQITLGLFGAARQTCTNAFDTLISSRLSRKTVTAELLVDLKKLDSYIHELDFESEALPLYRRAKAVLKDALGDKHDITWHAKVQCKHLHNLTSTKPEPIWLDALAGRNIRELMPMLVGETAYEQCHQIASWFKDMCSTSEPCYATRIIAKR